MTKEKCSNCGEEFEIWDLEPIGTGRRTQYLCRDCLAIGRYKVDRLVIGRFVKEKGKAKPK